MRANAQSFDQKIQVIEAAHDKNRPPVEVRFTSDEVSAEVAQSMGTNPTAASRNSSASPHPAVAQDNVEIKGYQVKLEGDVARGELQANVAGKELWVTLAGHLGSQDRYVTFD